MLNLQIEEGLVGDEHPRAARIAVLRGREGTGLDVHERKPSLSWMSTRFSGIGSVSSWTLFQPQGGLGIMAARLRVISLRGSC